MKNKQVIFTLIAIVLFISSCSQEENITETLEESQALITSNYIYKGETIVITQRVGEDGLKEVIEDASFKKLRDIYENQPTLMTVYGLSDEGAIYLFDNIKEHNEVTAIMNEIGDVPNGAIIEPLVICLSGNCSGTEDPTTRLYTSNNMKLYLDDILNWELDWTSSCYRNFNTRGSQERMENLSRNSNSFWDFRNSSQSCFPSGTGNANDQLSSLQVSPSIFRVTLYGNKNFGGHSITFYRRDVGLVEDLILGEVGISGPNNFPALNGWMFIPRLSAFSIGPFGILGNWNDRVSSIRLN